MVGCLNLKPPTRLAWSKEQWFSRKKLDLGGASLYSPLRFLIQSKQNPNLKDFLVKSILRCKMVQVFRSYRGHISLYRKQQMMFFLQCHTWVFYMFWFFSHGIGWCSSCSFDQLLVGLFVIDRRCGCVVFDLVNNLFDFGMTCRLLVFFLACCLMHHCWLFSILVKHQN